MSKRLWPILPLLAGLGGAACEPQVAELPTLDPSRHSELWGVAGERWRADGRLPDFSHAGYRGGDESPTPAVVANVRDYGALGDGESDDSAAFLEALDSAATGAILVPAGRYQILQPLKLERSGIVLRGAGRDRTTLYFPLSLSEAAGHGPHGGPHGWAWGGGWISAEGALPRETEKIARVTERAERGSDRLELSSTAGLEPGMRIRIVQREIEDGSLTLQLHNGHSLGGPCWIDRPGEVAFDWTVRLVEIDGTSVRLEQTLRVDVDPRWSPEIHPVLPTLSEIGIEGLTIEFPETEYAGHHREPGYNAIYLSNVADSWIEDVRTVHADTAISLWHSRTSSARGIEITGRGGHYGINLAASQDCLVTDFEIASRSLHDLSVAMLANGNVFSRGRGLEINFDHHRGAPYENLFTDIDVGESWRRRRLWDSSFTASGHYAAARETFWNVRPRVSTRWLPAWPQLTIVGPLKDPDSPHDRSLDDAWIESVSELAVPDLHRAQVERRIAATRSP